MAIMLAVPMGACARCVPNTVGTGVSRLTMRNLAALVTLLNDENVACSFESPDNKDQVAYSAELGSIGVGKWRVENCLIDIPPSDPYVTEDCNGVQTRVWGQVNVTAERRISGVLAGDEANPVIPGGPDGVVVEVERADFSNFHVVPSNSENLLEWVNGSISGKVAPRLAVDDDLGACSFVTSNAFIADVRYGSDSYVIIDTEDGMTIEVDVGGSNLFAVNGKHSGRENELWGSIDVWGGSYDVPDDEDGLDPDYNPDLFDTAYECESGLAQPITYACESFLGPILAQNSARITMLMLGRIATVLESDTKCGFSNREVLERARLEGEVGGSGVAHFEVKNCELDYPTSTVVSTGCQGSVSRAKGRVVVSATKRIEGRLTGDLETPVVPMNDAPAVFDLTVESFDDFEISDGTNAILVHNGGLSARVTPRVAADTEDSGACSFVSDIVRFEEVRWQPSTFTLSANEGTFQATVQQSELQALNGKWGGDENMLRGSIVLDEEPYQLPTDPEDDGLDPDYDPETFAAGWQCGTLEQPVRFDCTFDKPLAQGAAQLGVQTFGMMATLLEADEECGFSSQGVLDRVTVEGATGYPDARAVFTVDQPCELSFPEPTVIDTDCNGIRTYAQGKARVTGTMTQVGIASGDPNEPIVPTSRHPATLTLTGSFDDFAVWTDPGENILTIKNGRLSGSVSPRVAIDQSLGACSIITPVARIWDLRYDQASVIIEQDGRRFDAQISTSELQATNGNTETATNYLTGRLTMDGEAFSIPTDGDPILNPDYDQASFDRSYACLDNILVPKEESECNMKRAIGEGVARLLMLAVGTLASTVYSNDNCGFADFFVQIAPDSVEGDDGQPGRIVWTIDDCEMNGSPIVPNSVDCLGYRRYMAGRHLMDARLTVVGRREAEYVVFDSIVPDRPDAVTIDVLDARVSNYRIFDARPTELDAYRALEMPQGRLTGIVEPILGENDQARGTYDIATPVVKFSAVQLLEGARATVLTEGKYFSAYVDSAQLEGFNGSYVGLPGVTNTLRGQISIDGTLIDLDLPLDPDFEQTSFDESYACEAGLVATVPPE